MMGDVFFDLLAPGLRALQLISIQFPMLYLMTLNYLMFLHHYFENFLDRRWLKRHARILIAASLVLFFSDLRVILTGVGVSYVAFRTILFAIVAPSFVYIAWGSIRAYGERKESAEYVLVASASFLAYGFLLATNFFFDTHMGNLPVALFVMTTFALSLILSHQEVRALNRSEALSSKLIQYDQLKDAFMFKTSRELSAPLHRISNLSKLLMEGRAGVLNMEQQNKLMIIYKETGRLSELVEEILDVDAIQNRNLNLRVRPLSPYILSDAIDEMRYSIPEEKVIKIINRLPKNLPKVLADENRLKQILYNLLHNVIKFTDYGDISIQAEANKDKMLFSIIGNGVDVKASSLDLIFGNFYQEHLPGTDAGIGIGINLAKNLVELHGGELYVQSGYGGDTIFSFTIPLAVAHTRDSVVDMSSRESSDLAVEQVLMGDQGLTVLIAVDSKKTMNQIADYLNGKGFTVIGVTSGEKVLQWLEKKHFDFILLDLALPDISGLEIARKIRVNFDMVTLPIFILTLGGRYPMRKEGITDQINAFVSKTIEVDVLYQKIQSNLAIKQTVKRAVENEIKVLQNQITPHFLYNTINTIIGLSYSDEEKTREALEHLATYFRGKLDFERIYGEVALERELELIKAYLAIEKIRYGERLNIVYEIDESIRLKLPAMTLQPLVENAIRHGISKKELGGTVKITVNRVQQGEIILIVEDDGVGMSEEKRLELLASTQGTQHIGFSNVYRKVALLEHASLKLESQPGIGTRISIVIMEAEDDTGYFDRR